MHPGTRIALRFLTQISEQEGGKVTSVPETTNSFSNFRDPPDWAKEGYGGNVLPSGKKPPERAAGG